MSNKKRIYTVATSHLDTIWSWDFETTVSKYIYNTLVENISMMKKYPSYVFSFEGSFRYELMEEYYPELFVEMKKYIDEGRWHVTGSSYENGDVNCPSPEALFRNILFGNSYFDEKFGKRSCDIYLPDCFGFGWALPSIANHSNLKGFTTQKLAWGCAYGTPFDIGKWYGVDGNYIYASANPHDYYFTLTKLREWDFVTNKLKENEKYDFDWTYMFHGIGDRGGSPEEATVKYVDEEIKKNDSSNIEVIAASADQIFRDMQALPTEVLDKLPTWNTELVMQNHGVGGYTSRAIGKRWNARCQEIADVAERASVFAMNLGSSEYNERSLEKSWKRAIAHQFHDDTPGTSVQRAYKRSWNDYAMSMNQLTGELETALVGISKNAKSDFCTGTPVMVFNPVEIDRTNVVEVEIPSNAKQFARVFDSKGKEQLSQVISNDNNTIKLIFSANVPSIGFNVFDIRLSDEACPLTSDLEANDSTIENSKYIVSINKAGNICSIIDKFDNDREILDKPIVLGLFNYTGSKEWPAWEMNFDEANKSYDRIPKLVSLELIENGPVRSTIKVTQEDGKSVFESYISLSVDSEIVEVFNEIEWQSMRTMCKNRFSFTSKNKLATFDLGLGAIQRENMCEKLFEVPAQKWADITDESNEYGVSVISECKHGWDKYDDNTLRLTAIHTPKKNYRIDSMQSMMDLGLNRYGFAIYSHKGKVGKDTQIQARLYTNKLIGLTFDKHQGDLGTTHSFVNVNNNDVIVRAIKKSHHLDDESIVIRLNEGSNKTVKDYTITLGDGIESATEIYASEEYKCDANVIDGKLMCDFKPYEVKSFKIVLKKANSNSIIKSKNIELTRSDKHIKYQIPNNICPDNILVNGVNFELSTKYAFSDEQDILKVDNGNQLHLLIASLEKDVDCEFIVNNNPVKITVNSIDESFARWDLYDFEETAYIKDGKLGYVFTHSLDESGNVLYAKELYFWHIVLDGSTKLPNDHNIIVLAASEAPKTDAKLVTRMYDKIENNRPFTFYKSFKEQLWYVQSKMLWNINDKDDYFIHNNNGKNGKRIEQSAKRTKTRTVETVGH